jgi:hypothetical protein
MEWMVAIDRIPVQPNAIGITTFFNYLLFAFMVLATERLERPKPEQVWIAVMRNNMVNNLCCAYCAFTLAHHAQGLPL